MGTEKKQTKHSIFNLFDIVVIIFVVILAAILAILHFSGSKTPEGQANTVTYTIELTGFHNNSADLIQVGDVLKDNVRNNEIGTIVDVQVSNSIVLAQDYENGGAVESELNTQQTAIITLEADCTETDRDISVGEDFIIKVGTSVSANGPGYSSTGVVLGIER